MHTTRTSTIIKVFVCIYSMVFLLGIDDVNAQNNVYKIKDELYTIYHEAFLKKREPEGLRLADSLFHEAKKKKDLKAQCMALTIPVLYYYQKYDQPENMANAVDKLKAFAKKTPYEQYYYFACANFMNYMLNSGHPYVALRYAKETYEDAKAVKSHYGIFTSIKMIGNIYLAREEYVLAEKNFIEALNYARENLPNEDKASLCHRIASCCNNQGKYQQAITYATEGAKTAKTALSRLRNDMELAVALYELGEKSKFIDLYNKILPEYKKIDKSITSIIWQLNAYYYLAQGKNSEAVAAVMNNPSKYRRQMILSRVYYHMGDYQKAYESFNTFSTLRDSLNSRLTRQDLSDQNAIIGNNLLRQENQRIELENKRMELENANLSIANYNLALGRARDSANAAKINAANMQLKYENQRLEDSRTKAELDKKILEEIRKNEQAESIHTLMLTILVAVSILFALSVVYMIFRAQMTRKLRKSNEELQNRNIQLIEARERAEQADKLKTMFLQNMSHEIRTPLNAIVGFSQLLAESGDSLDEDERRDFSNRVEENSDLVLNIINDVLDISTLESGHYKMAMAEHNVNDMCRMSLGTVRDRVPEGVTTRFTSDVDDNYSIVTDYKRVEQIIINFLTNACKNTVEGEIHLDCSTTENPGYLSFSVTDTGVGIAPEKMDVIFERFRKLDEFKQGVGLGLNICCSIADRFNGNIYVDKSHTKGARFVFALPLENK